MASNLVAMASNLEAMASNLRAYCLATQEWAAPRCSTPRHPFVDLLLGQAKLRALDGGFCPKSFPGILGFDYGIGCAFREKSLAGVEGKADSVGCNMFFRRDMFEVRREKNTNLQPTPTPVTVRFRTVSGLSLSQRSGRLRHPAALPPRGSAGQHHGRTDRPSLRVLSHRRAAMTPRLPTWRPGPRWIRPPGNARITRHQQFQEID